MEERSESRASGTTYHSFADTELFEPMSPPRPPVTHDTSSLQHLEHLQHELQRQQREAPISKDWVRERRPPTAKMQRQDSGYESNTPRRTSTSNTSHGGSTINNSHLLVGRRSSNGSSKDGSGSSNGSGVRTRFRDRRPSLRRAAKTHLAQHTRTSNQSLHLVRTNTATASAPATAAATQPKAAFFHFPSPDPIQLADSVPDRRVQPTPIPSPPPQTTHYWTSDRTRRLEYAAIDAATRGVKGWVRRHLVPDCFVSHENRHVSFDDDSGSVRRYRLELEDDHHAEKSMGSGKPVRRRKGWKFWRRQKAEAQPTAYI
ncbi:hypothetical protein F53441_5541 [Fusarium austroafricanum]|uniref:Uncharacterized protein n=1 Tax=Fusarium austroafricanum TaxID=2364996 RepID=A0A8H4KLG4_9HYPO|nr:hypothetical protein F53441_5541 [Fusarium austroafricanum]